MSAEDGQRLSDAAFSGDVAKIDELLKGGIPIDTCDRDGFTALHRSCVTGNVAVITFLLDKGAKVNMEDSYGDTPLHYACFCGHTEVAKLLVARGADPNKPSRDGKTPLESAQEEGHLQLVVTVAPESTVGKAAAAAIASGKPASGTPITAAAGAAGAPGSYVAPAAPSLGPPGAGALPGGSSSSGAAGGGGGGGGPPRMIGGLDFSRGVILEGELRKKRANKLMKWRNKYYVLSRTYAALFFWTGTRDRVDGIIKKVRFETFYSVRHFPNKHGGKRFELRVVTGRSMQLLAENAEEARRWVQTLKSVLGGSMAVLRIQSTWRGHRARKVLKKLQQERQKAVAAVSHSGASGAGGAGAAGAGGAGAAGSGTNRLSLGAGASNVHGTIKSGAAQGGILSVVTGGGHHPSSSSSGSGSMGSKKVSGNKLGLKGAGDDKALDVAVTLRADGVLMEGELKKKNSTTLSSFFTAYRTRYFVLYAPDGALYYFDSKAQRQLGTKPRAIPFISFFSVYQVQLSNDGNNAELPPPKASSSGRGRAGSSSTSGSGAGAPGGALNSARSTSAHAAATTGIKTNRFKLRITSGRVFEFEARSPAAAELWVSKILSVLPRENACAIKIQAVWRGHKARKAYRVLKANSRDVVRALVRKYKGDPVTEAKTKALKASALTVQSYMRMRVARRAYAKALALRLEAEAAALGAASSGSKPSAGDISASATAARLAKLKELRAMKASAAANNASADSNSPWKKFVDQASGRPYWYNATTKETTWTDPNAPVYGDWRELVDETTKKTYYHNIHTNEVVWQLPAEAAAIKAQKLKEAAKSKARWIRKREGGEGGRVYFANVDNGETCWGIPPGMAEGKARLLGYWFAKDVTPPTDPPSQYFVHAESSTTTWERPEGYESDEDYSDRLLALKDWVEVIDPSSNRPYYFHKTTQERTWVNPFSTCPLGKLGAAVDGAHKPRTPRGPKKQATEGEDGKPPLKTGASVRSLSRGSTSFSNAAASTSLSSVSRKSISTRRVSSALNLTAGNSDIDNAWQSAVDPRTNRTYWYNTITGESSWEPPEGMAAATDGAAAASPDAPQPLDAGEASEAMTFALFLNATLESALASSPAETGNEAVQAKLPIALDASSLASPLPPHLAHLPPLFTVVRDGILLCRLVHALSPDMLDPRAVDYTAAAPNAAAPSSDAGSGAGAVPAASHSNAALENCRLALAAAAAAGCVFGRDVTATALSEGKAVAVLDFLWQCLKLASVAWVSVRATGNMGLLKLSIEGETADDILALPPETLLRRWVNFHCHKLISLPAAATGPASPSTNALTSVLNGGLVQDFGCASLNDGTALCALIRTVLPDTLTAAVPAVTGTFAEAEATVNAAGGSEAAITNCLSAAFGAGVPAWFGVDGLKAGNIRLQMAFLAYLFKAAPALTAADAPSAPGASSTALASPATASKGRERSNTGKDGRDVSALAADILAKLGNTSGAGKGIGATSAASSDGERSEAASLAQWINSLDIEGVYIGGSGGDSLVQSLKDGVTLLQVLDVVQPGLVNWSKVNMPPSAAGSSSSTGKKLNRYKQVENCNMAIQVGKAMDFHLVNVGGLDICDGNSKLVLAYLWQVMRYHTLQQLSKLAFDGFTAEESEILKWANQRAGEAAVAAGGNADSVKVNSFADPALSSGIYLLYLLSSIREGCVDWSVVADGTDKGQQLSNAKYILSVARKLGAQVFCTASDIVDARSKPLMLLVASLMVADTRERKGLGQATDGAHAHPAAAAVDEGAAGADGWGAIEEEGEDDDSDDEDSDGGEDSDDE